MRRPKIKPAHLGRAGKRKGEELRREIWTKLLDSKTPGELIAEGYKKPTVYRYNAIINKTIAEMKDEKFLRTLVKAFVEFWDTDSFQAAIQTKIRHARDDFKR